MPSPIATASNPKHGQNANSPIDVTEHGIVMFFYEEHDSNTSFSIFFNASDFLEPV